MWFDHVLHIEAYLDGWDRLISEFGLTVALQVGKELPARVLWTWWFTWFFGTYARVHPLHLLHKVVHLVLTLSSRWHFLFFFNDCCCCHWLLLLVFLFFFLNWLLLFNNLLGLLFFDLWRLLCLWLLLNNFGCFLFKNSLSTFFLLNKLLLLWNNFLLNFFLTASRYSFGRSVAFRHWFFSFTTITLLLLFLNSCYGEVASVFGILIR